MPDRCSFLRIKFRLSSLFYYEIITFAVNMKQSFENRIAWIVGASSGIGEEISSQINAAGGIVVLSARNKEKLEAVQQRLKFPEKSMILCLDVIPMSYCYCGKF